VWDNGEESQMWHGKNLTHLPGMALKMGKGMLSGLCNEEKDAAYSHLTPVVTPVEQELWEKTSEALSHCLLWQFVTVAIGN
jgi:hypothetical protein